MLSSDPKLCRDLSLIALGKCPFPTKTNEIHGASRSPVNFVLSGFSNSRFALHHIQLAEDQKQHHEFVQLDIFL